MTLATPLSFETVVGARMVRPLVGGVSAETYLAECAEDGAPIVVKQLTRGSGHDPDRILQEALRIRRLGAGNRGANLVEILYVGFDRTNPDTLRLAMPYYEGGSLESQVGGCGLTPRQAVEYSRAVLNALTRVHAEQVLHFDIKPANVLIDGLGHARLSDFGHALELDPAFNLANPGQTTPLLHSVEKLKGRPVGPAADLHQVGILLYWLLHGTPFILHERTRVSSYWLQAVADGLDRHFRWAPHVPDDLKAVIGRAVAPPGARRFRAAADMANALAGCALDAPFSDFTFELEPSGDRVCRGEPASGRAWSGRLAATSGGVRVTCGMDDGLRFKKVQALDEVYPTEVEAEAALAEALRRIA